jgi:glucuronoarabinoxylan endo-1,4-beta-xylanase
MNGDKRILMKWLTLLFLMVGPMCYAQTATINWANTHQVIDGFGGNDVGMFPAGYNMSSAQLAEVFGTTGTELGLTVIRTQIPNGSTSTSNTGDCTSVSTSCEGALLSDLTGAASYGVKIVATPFGFPAAYTTNGSVSCSAGSGSGTLANAHYQDYANWTANFIKSLSGFSGVTVYAVGIDNEPEFCDSSAQDSAIMSDANIDTYVKSYLGPALASNALTPVVFTADTGYYSDMTSFSACEIDSSCAAYLGAYSFHDYGAQSQGTPGTVSDTPYPSGWASGKSFWVLEASCKTNGSMPSWCNPSNGFDPSWTNAMYWASWVDQRLAVDNVGLVNGTWWFYVDAASNDQEGLVESSTLRSGDVYAVSGRAYVLAQYSRWVRPGYYRIDATHIPQAGISVSAYQDAPSGHLVIVATNYTAAPLTQTFSLANAPAFTSVTPYISSASQDIQQQAAQPMSSNAFSYSLPAYSVTTFVGASSTSASPAAPTNLQATVN